MGPPPSCCPSILSFKWVRGTPSYFRELKALGMDPQEEVEQLLDVSAWTLPRFPSEYGTCFPFGTNGFYQHYALGLFQIIWTATETLVYIYI